MNGVAFGEIVAEYLEGMEQWTGSLAVVTGASGGVGSELVGKLVKLGVNVSIAYHSLSIKHLKAANIHLVPLCYTV